MGFEEKLLAWNQILSAEKLSMTVILLHLKNIVYEQLRLKREKYYLVSNLQY